MWVQVSDAELQAMYYSSLTERAKEVWHMLRHHPEHSREKTFRDCMVDEMAWRWMRSQTAMPPFVPATQDVNALE